MKSNTTLQTLTIPFYFILIHIFSNSIYSYSQNTYPPVLDTDGHELQIGVEYYITSAFWGAGGGGLILDVTGNQTCPLSVIQLPYDTQYGLPLTLHPANSGERIIRESTDINIKFEAPIFCAESTVLKVTKYDESAGKQFVEIGGELGNPGCKSVRNWFKIEVVAPGYYKLVHRPTVCDDVVEMWPEDVGIYKQERMRRLALTADVPPYLLVFRKALFDRESV